MYLIPPASLQSPAALSACLLSLLFLSHRARCLTANTFEFRSDRRATACATVSSPSHLIVFSLSRKHMQILKKRGSQFVVKSEINIQYALCRGSVERVNSSTTADHLIAFCSDPGLVFLQGKHN